MQNPCKREYTSDCTEIVVGLNVISSTCLIAIDLQSVWDPKTVQLEISMNRVVIDAKTFRN